MTNAYDGYFGEVYAALSDRDWLSSTEIINIIEQNRIARRRQLGLFQAWLDLFLSSAYPSIGYTYAGLEELVRLGWAEIRLNSSEFGRYQWRRRASRGTRVQAGNPAPAALPA